MFLATSIHMEVTLTQLFFIRSQILRMLNHQGTKFSHNFFYEFHKCWFCFLIEKNSSLNLSFLLFFNMLWIFFDASAISHSLLLFLMLSILFNSKALPCYQTFSTFSMFQIWVIKQPHVQLFTFSRRINYLPRAW